MNVAVVGVGYWGVNYIRLLNELPRVGKVIACDPRPDALEPLRRRYPSLETVDSVEGLGAMGGIDAAIVCTPAATHHSVASRLLDEGLHLLVEKPFTETSVDAIDLIRLAEKAGLTVAVGHTFLHNPAVKVLSELLRAGRFGQLYYMYARRTNLGPIRTDVNALWDLGPHDISVFNHLMGSAPLSVSAVGHRALRSNREDVGFISMTYAGNVVAHVHVSWADPSKVRELVLVGQDCRVVFNDLDATERIRIFEKGVDPVPVEGGSFAEHVLQIRDGDIISPHIPWSEPLSDQVHDFLDSIAEGRPPLSPPSAGYDVVRVMEAIDLSVAAHGAPTRIEGPDIKMGDRGNVIELVPESTPVDPSMITVGDRS